MKTLGKQQKMLPMHQKRLLTITGVLRATLLLRRGDCSVLEVSEEYFITGLASDGDWAPNDQIWETGWELG